MASTIVQGDIGRQRSARLITLFNATAFTGAQAIVSPVIDLLVNGSGFNIEMVSTGTPTGTYQLESSNLYDPVSNPSATFFAATSNPTPAFPVPAGAGAQTFHAVGHSLTGNAPGRYVRLRYTNTSGTGTLTAVALVVADA